MRRSARDPEHAPRGVDLTRVLCLTSWYPPHHYGGYETGCYDVMTRLEGRGHHVEVLCGDERLPGAGPATDHERSVRRSLRLYHRDGDVWSPPLRERLAIERHNRAALLDALDAHRPEVVSIWHVGAMSVGLVTEVLRRGLPVVYSIQDLWPAYAVALDPWLRMFARSRLVGRAAERATGLPATVPDLDRGGGFCFISRLTRERLRQGTRWSYACSGVVYSGIDLELFRPPTAAAAPAAGTRILYVGRLDVRKGIETVLRALVDLPDASASIVGRGPDEERRRLLALVAELDLAGRVELSHAERADLPAIYAAADACVFPSEWEEPFGLVPLEAMACGTPVVATGRGGSGEYLVHERNCLRFEAGDPAALADAVRRLTSDAALRAALVAGGRRTAAAFDIEQVTDAYEGWHAAAVAGFPDGPLPDRIPPS